MAFLRTLSCIAAAGFLIGAAPFAPPKTGTRTIYRHATLIDPVDLRPRSDVAVIIDGERVAAVLADRDLTRSQINGAQQVDLSGRFLVPGYIDSHQHLATPPDRAEAEARLKRDIYSGITATRDMADDLRQVGDLARAAQVGEIASPDIYYAALMAGPSFFDDPRTSAAALGAIPGKVPWMQAIGDGTDLPIAVAMARGTYATAVKIYANLPGRTVAAITGEAHRQGMKVWTHGMVFPATPSEVVGAGVDTVSHTCYLAYQAMSTRPDSYQHRFPIEASLFEHDNPVLASLFADMRRRGTILDATVHVYREVEAGAKKAGRPPLCTVALAARLTNQAYRAGVAISTGTDGDTPSGDALPSLFDEFALLGGPAGMKTGDVLRAATLTGARAAGQEKDMGSIEPGKLANMVVLSANPLADVRNLRSIVMTVKRGRQYARAGYRR
jgi:imidazolonepropionase-like amidohydrolase